MEKPEKIETKKTSPMEIKKDLTSPPAGGDHPPSFVKISIVKFMYLQRRLPREEVTF